MRGSQGEIKAEDEDENDFENEEVDDENIKKLSKVADQIDGVFLNHTLLLDGESLEDEPKLHWD